MRHRFGEHRIFFSTATRCSSSLRAAVPRSNGDWLITGNRQLEADLGSWMTLSPFARIEKKVA
jgi:hypothetical protein